MPSLDKVETIEEIVAFFNAFMEEIQSKLVEKRSMKQGDLAKKHFGVTPTEFRKSAGDHPE